MLCIANRALPMAFEHSSADDVTLNGKSCMTNYGKFRHVVNKIPTDFFEEVKQYKFKMNFNLT